MKHGAKRPPRVLIYERVSTDEQVQSGAGLADQHHACVRWVEREGLELIGVVVEDEGVSGSTPPQRRPRLVEGVALMRRGDILLVAKRDRVMRDLVQIGMYELYLKSIGVRIVSAAGEGTSVEDERGLDPMTRAQLLIVRTLTDLFAEIELIHIRARTSKALVAKRRQGERNGRLPYGCDLVDTGKRSKVRNLPDGRTEGGLPIGLAPNPREREGIDLILSSRAEGLTFRAIARRLEERGYRAKAGAPLRHSSVAHLYHYHSRERQDHENRPTSRGEAGDALRPAS